MPTGYTQKLVEEGQSFPDFVMTCARAMGATISMRDEPHDAPIPIFTVPAFYHENVTEAEKRLAELIAMPESERLEFSKAEARQDSSRNAETLHEMREQNERLQKMKAAVDEWEPPTPDHSGLKKFMLQQIEVSVRDESHLTDRGQASSQDPMERYAQALEFAEHSLEYSKESLEQEIARVAARNAWVKALRDSLGLPSPEA